MTNIPVNSPETFGDAEQSGTAATIDLVAQAPEPQPWKQRPAVKRVLQGNRANLILFTFLPGQVLPDHEAAHPIFVQAITGRVTFTVGDEVTTLTPGTIMHVDQHVRHRVDCPEDADPAGSVFLLTMLTGEDR